MRMLSFDTVNAQTIVSGLPARRKQYVFPIRNREYRVASFAKKSSRSSFPHVNGRQEARTSSVSSQNEHLSTRKDIAAVGMPTYLPSAERLSMNRAIWHNG